MLRKALIVFAVAAAALSPNLASARGGHGGHGGHGFHGGGHFHHGFHGGGSGGTVAPRITAAGAGIAG